MSETQTNASGIDNNLSVDEKTGELEAQILRGRFHHHFTSQMIQNMRKEELLHLQKFFGLGPKWGQIVWPKTWKPRARKHEEYDVENSLRSFARNESELDLAIVTLLRTIFIILVAPTTGGQYTPKHMALSQIRHQTYASFIPFIRAALSMAPGEDGKLYGRIGIHNVPTESESVKKGWRAQQYRLNDLRNRGLFNDVLQEEVQDEKPTDPTVQKPKPATDQFMPLPDPFVHHVGQAAAIYTREVMPVLLDALEQCVEHRRTGGRRMADGRYSHGKGTVNFRAKAFLEKYNWRTVDGRQMTTLPIPLNLPWGTKGKQTEFPPRNWADLNRLVALGQAANHIIAGLSVGPRISELFSLKTTSLVESNDGGTLIKGRTFKLVEKIGGEERLWPLPELAIVALHHQTRLANLYDEILSEAGRVNRVQYVGEKPLWRVCMGCGIGNQLGETYNNDLRWFVDCVGMTHLLDDQAFTNHRFRKTIARLAALALMHAPKILMDIFGHKSIEMTMHYILATPTIRAEIKAIGKELALMRAKKAIANAELNGGPAAEPLRKLKRLAKFETAEDYNAETLDELGQMITFQGRTWMIASEYVLCTKLPDQVGPCAAKQSMPNPARCRTDCNHRLEEAEGRKQVDGTIRFIVDTIQQAQASGEMLMIEMYQGQLRTHIRRFQDLFEKWSNHRVVMEALNEELVGQHAA